MRHTVLGATLLGLLLSTTPIGAQRSSRRVVDAAGIAAAGWHHLGDIVDALPTGSVATTDGFNHQLTGSRVGFVEAGTTNARWMVRLDGQVMPVNIEGLWILDAIPVAITQIDSVVITEGPRLVDGRQAVLGTIDLYTRVPPRGPSIVADYQHGDESGDPGPYRYTARATTNVEKLGPFTSGALAVASARASLDLAARYSSLNITDQRIVNRLPGVFGRLQSDVNASGGSGVLTGHFAGGDHYLVAGRGRFTGLAYLPAPDADRSTRVITSHVGITGSARVERVALRYGLTGSQLDVDSLGDVRPFALQQERMFGDAFLEAGSPQGPLRVGLGLNTGRQKTGSGDTTTTRQRHAERAWATYTGRHGDANIGIERSLGGIGASVALRQARALADSQELALSLVAFNTWRDGGDVWMDGFRSPLTHEGSSGAIDARVELSTRSLAGFVPTWYLRGFAFPGLGDNASNAAIAGGVLATANRGRSSLRLRAEVSEQVGNAGPDDGTTPGGFLEAFASAVTPGHFRVAVSGRYAPRTLWPQLEPGAMIYDPEVRRVDLSVNKWMWHERVHAQLVVRNAFNQPEITHPLGAQWNLRTHLAVTIALPSAGGDR